MDALSHAPLEALAVPELLDRAVARFAERPAMAFEGRRWSYAQLGTLVDRAAAGLQRLGVAKGDRVGLCLPNTPYYIVFYYAALQAGAVVVNYNPLYVARELHAQVTDSETTTMVVPDLAAIYPKVAGLLGQTCLQRLVVCPFAGALPAVKGAAFRLLKRAMVARPDYGPAVVPWREVIAPAGSARVAIDPQDLAVLQYTGGTTGVPKGAMLSHANLTVNAQQVIHHMPSMREGEERLMGVLPFFHVFAMTSVLNCGVLMGGEIILHPRFEIGAVMKSLVR
ncbi:MAG TPA: AMP-binding protein, partial [Rhodopila sp.]|nr:AMP-binding protein [Rhodopila sp.]